MVSKEDITFDYMVDYHNWNQDTQLEVLWDFIQDCDLTEALDQFVANNHAEEANYEDNKS